MVQRSAAWSRVAGEGGELGEGSEGAEPGTRRDDGRMKAYLNRSLAESSTMRTSLATLVAAAASAVALGFTNVTISGGSWLDCEQTCAPWRC